MLSLSVSFLIPSNIPSVATAPPLFPFSSSSIGKLQSLTFVASLLVLKNAWTYPADPGCPASGLENALYRATSFILEPIFQRFCFSFSLIVDATASANSLAGSRAHKPSAITERKALAVTAVVGESQRTNLSRLPVDSPREIQGVPEKSPVLSGQAFSISLVRSSAKAGGSSS